MHRVLRDALPGARGVSDLVVAGFVDVRGFSSFARMAESAEAALFLRSVYLKIVSDYFADAAFFKPTGDGLLVVMHYDDANLHHVVQSTVDASFRLIEDFPTICDGDPMVNFDVPHDIGIGLARGAATALVSGEQVLDYSGRPLNLAARLMDMARPKGLVIDASVGVGLLTEAQQAELEPDNSIYVRGIDPDQPRTVHTQRAYVQIDEVHKHPVRQLMTRTLAKEYVTAGKLVERCPIYRHQLPREPGNKGYFKLLVRHPAVMPNGRKHSSITETQSFDGKLDLEAGVAYAMFSYEAVVKALNNNGVKKTWPIRLVVEYEDYPD